MKKSRKLKLFLMLKIIEIKSNLGLNKLARMKTGNDMMLLDLIILQKLLKIFMFVILLNRNFKQELESQKRIYLLEKPCL